MPASAASALAGVSRDALACLSAEFEPGEPPPVATALVGGVEHVDLDALLALVAAASASGVPR